MKELPVHGGGDFRCSADTMARGHAYRVIQYAHSSSPAVTFMKLIRLKNTSDYKVVLKMNK